jgi:hypothetical protein
MGYHRTLAQVDNTPGLIFMAAAFCVTTIASVALRFYARRLTRLGYGADDWLSLASMVRLISNPFFG